MKRSLIELPVWCLVVIVALLFTAIWVVDAFTTNVGGCLMARLSNHAPWNSERIAYLYDGTLIGYLWADQTYVIDPPSALGLIVFWSPVAASVGVGLLAPIFALLPTLGVPFRKRIPIRRPRLTLFRVMVLVGTVSAWLWLGRFDLEKRIVGTLIIGFMLHAGFRRSFLAKEASKEPAEPKILSRAGIAGYSLVLLLTLVWVITILVWDSYQPR